MKIQTKRITQALIAGGILLGGNLAYADDREEIEKLRALVQELDQKIKVLDRKSELAAEEAVAKKKETPVVVAGDKGFGIKSADGNFEFKLRGLLQADSRTFFGDDSGAGVPGTSLDDEYLLRRVRPTFEGTVFGKYDFRFTPDFAPEAANVQDAYINARFTPWFKVQAGKFKVPYSLERLQSGGDLRFVERSYVANSLLPNRDIGVQLHGEVFKGKLNYAAGVFDGVSEGGSNATNRDNGAASKDKEFVARLFAEPFKGEDSVLAGLGFGVAAGTSDYKNDGFLNPQFRSPGQLTFFTYNAAVVGDGKQTRIAPQFYYYYGPFGVIGEYARVKHDVARGGNEDTLEHDGWQLAGTYVLTGEENSFKGITPKRPFDLDKGQWGAWEVALRYSELNVDDAAFDDAAAARFASATSTTESAESWAAGVNWYLNKFVKLQTTFEQTKFDSAFANVRDRDTERVLFSRFQVSF
ncbi:MAG TPA: porin [Methylophilaceae bacterium]|nr:porin [Methylophilaceae bacterium]